MMVKYFMWYISGPILKDKVIKNIFMWDISSPIFKDKVINGTLIQDYQDNVAYSATCKDHNNQPDSESKRVR